MKEDGEESLLVGEEGDTSKSGRDKLEYDLELVIGG